jgi:hypothetical protein
MCMGTKVGSVLNTTQFQDVCAVVQQNVVHY